MSDNVTELNIKKPRTLLKRILLLLLVVLVVLGGVAVYVFRDQLNLDSLRRYLKYLDVTGTGQTGHYSYDEHSGNQYADFHDGLAIASVSGLNTYSHSGESECIIQTALTTPAIRVAGKNVLAFDAGGYSLELANSAGALLSVTAPRPILDADISADGCVCYATSETGYKTVLYVYNKNQAMIYKWLSSSQYLPICAVNKGAEYMAAVAMGQSGGIFTSTINIFKTDSEEIFGTISLGNELIYDLKFWDDKTLCAIGETGVSWYSLDGTPLGQCQYADSYLKDFDLGGSGFLTLVLNMYKAGNRYSLVTVGQDGSALGSLYIGEEILDTSAAGNYVAVLTADTLHIYDKALTLYAQQDNTNAATSVVMREDGSAILLGNSEGTLFVP